MSPKIKQFSWWMAVILAATLPITFSWSLQNLGGHVTEWMYYGSYHALMSLCFLTTAFLIGWLMTKPSKYLGLRFTFAFVSIIVCLLAAIAPRATCEEKLFFAAIGTAKPAPAAIPTACEV